MFDTESCTTTKLAKSVAVNTDKWKDCILLSTQYTHYNNSLNFLKVNIVEQYKF